MGTKKPRIISATLIAGMTLSLVQFPARSVEWTTPEEMCLPEVLALEANQDAIDVHNAKPHVFKPGDPALQAYNEEARELNVGKAHLYIRWLTCQDLLTELQDGQQSDLSLEAITGRTAATREKVQRGKDAIPANWTPPPPPSPGRQREMPRDNPARALYDVLRDHNPRHDLGEVTLKGQPRPRVGDPDPAYPGRRIEANGDGEPAVSADHIISLPELMSMPGFMKLKPEFMYMLTRAPFNFQWLSYSANRAKSSRGAAFVQGADPAWVAEQIELANHVRDKMKAWVDLLAQMS